MTQRQRIEKSAAWWDVGYALSVGPMKKETIRKVARVGGDLLTETLDRMMNSGQVSFDGQRYRLLCV